MFNKLAPNAAISMMLLNGVIKQSGGGGLQGLRVKHSILNTFNEVLLL
ncbi:MAG: hypothetical protein L6Q29_03910 [Candidatus Pacebacteria bacterium]|nr:hypothetical protein [Candidatus Paceibacterota bacterium]